VIYSFKRLCQYGVLFSAQLSTGSTASREVGVPHGLGGSLGSARLCRSSCLAGLAALCLSVPPKSLPSCREEPDCGAPCGHGTSCLQAVSACCRSLTHRRCASRVRWPPCLRRVPAARGARSAPSQAMPAPGRYPVRLWKQVRCDDLLGDVQLGLGGGSAVLCLPDIAVSAAGSWDSGQSARPYRSEQNQGPQGQAVSVPRWWEGWRPGVMCGSAVSVAQRLGPANSTARGILHKSYKPCLWVSLLLQGKYSMVQPLNSLNSRSNVSRQSLIHRSRKGLYPSDYSVL